MHHSVGITYSYFTFVVSDTSAFQLPSTSLSLFFRAVSFFNSNGIQTYSYIILNWESLLVTYFGGICNKQLVFNFGTMFKSLLFFILCSNHSLGHFRNSRAKKKNEEGQPVKRRLKLSVQIKLILSPFKFIVQLLSQFQIRSSFWFFRYIEFVRSRHLLYLLYT